MTSSKEILRALRTVGYTIRAGRGKGSHSLAYFQYQGRKACVTVVQMAQDIPKGTLSSIRRAIGLREQREFEKFIRGELTRDEYICILLRQGFIGTKEHEE